jgi:hypothetical protein
MGGMAWPMSRMCDMAFDERVKAKERIMTAGEAPIMSKNFY